MDKEVKHTMFYWCLFSLMFSLFSVVHYILGFYDLIFWQTIFLGFLSLFILFCGYFYIQYICLKCNKEVCIPNENKYLIFIIICYLVVIFCLI